MKIQRAVQRSQWQEDDRSLIRHMGQASTFLNDANEQPDRKFLFSLPIQEGIFLRSAFLFRGRAAGHRTM